MKKIGIHVLRLLILVSAVTLLVSCKDEEEPIVEPTMFDVTFDADNGTSPVVVEVEEGKTVAEPADPEKDGYTFDAWQLNGSDYVFTTPVTADITLVASYTLDVIIVEPEEYTVSFNSVGGTSITSQVVEEGDLATEPNAPEKDAFSFDGWLLDGEAYDFDTPVDGDIELYAKYSFIGIPDTPDYEGRAYNADFDQLINDFSSATLISTNTENAFVDGDQPYISVGYSGT
ncbi:MAG: InlB B-repeat-containing protein, partial [Acholeplasmataceae bacterium]